MDQILGIFYVLLGLAMIISLFGIVNTLALSVMERTRELGMLRAFGMTRRGVRRMIRHESIVTALVGATLGIAVGLLLAALATTALSEEGLRFALPLGSLVAFTVVAAWPARSLRSARPGAPPGSTWCTPSTTSRPPASRRAAAAVPRGRGRRVLGPAGAYCAATAGGSGSGAGGAGSARGVAHRA